MKNLIKNWYYIVVYLAAMVALILALGNWSLREKTLLISLVFILLHFFEEFGFPGGFPWVGMKVEMKVIDSNPQNWPLNLVSSFFGNMWFAVLVYLLPLFLPNIRFLTLAAVIFAFIEAIGHLCVFNIAMKVWYNPGLITAVFGLTPVSVYYLNKSAGQYHWSDFILAFVWILFNYWISFRSPIYNRLGNMSHRYAFNDDEVFGVGRYMEKHKNNNS